jgi:protein TonB
VCGRRAAEPWLNAFAAQAGGVAGIGVAGNQEPWARTPTTGDRAMTVPTVSSLSATRPLPIRWPRVGALSTSFSLHGVAAAVFLLAVSAPRVDLEQRPALVPALTVTLVEPPPVPAPPPPTLSAPPPVAAATPTPVNPTRPATPQPATPTPSRLLPESPLAAPVEAPAVVPATATVSAAVDYATVSRPPYPAAAARRGAEGEVLVRVLVGIDGWPTRTQLARSSGDRDLDRAALAAVRSWRFRPAQAAGSPVAAWVDVPVAFRLGRR